MLVIPTGGLQIKIGYKCNNFYKKSVSYGYNVDIITGRHMMNWEQDKISDISYQEIRKGLIRETNKAFLRKLYLAAIKREITTPIHKIYEH